MNYVHGLQALGVASILLAALFLFGVFCAGMGRLFDKKPNIAISIVVAVFVVVIFLLGAVPS